MTPTRTSTLSLINAGRGGGAVDGGWRPLSFRGSMLVRLGRSFGAPQPACEDGRAGGLAWDGHPTYT
jgi:hypothetical protein